MKNISLDYSIANLNAIGFLVLLLAFSFQEGLAQRFPTNFAGVRVATNLDPVGMDITPDGRVFLAEKDGKILVIKNDAVLSTPLIDIPKVDNFSERGLLKVLVDPNFARNGYIYTYYTTNANGVSRNRVSRFKVEGDVASPGSEKVLIEVDPVDGPKGFHNGGGLAIRNGQLYISIGESTVADNSQSFSTLKGKILRINTDGSIPTDNPFYNSTSGKNRAIWALGLRNPFRLAVQNGTGKIFSTDVGAGSYEEINEVEKGKNYGWPGIEGRRTNQTPPSNYKDPLYAYPHSGGACSITAGAFYNPPTAQFPASYVGKFFFGDYCAGWIKTIDPVTKAVADFATSVNRPLDIIVSKEGAMYFISRGEGDNTSSVGGVLWKVNYTGNGKPVIGVQPTSKTVSVGQAATFDIEASGNPRPTYQWQRNGANISGATSSRYTLSNPKLSDSGAKFRAVVRNSEGTATSSEATLTVINNDSPVPTITSPVAGKTYSGGEAITFSGTATDKEDGNLPASAFTWRIDLYHFDDPAHSHPAMDPTSGIKSDTFIVPTEMETSPNVLFRIFLTVTDSKGASKTVSRDIVPIISTITLNTKPAGLKLKLDGSVVTTPYTFKGAKGILRAIEAVSPQTVNGVNYAFSSWSDNGARAHTISTPGTNSTLTANFAVSTNAGILSGGVYEMQPQHDLGLRLDVRGASAENSTLVDGYRRNGNLNQQWKFIGRSDGLWEIEPQHAPGKRLDVAGVSTANNTEIHIYQRTGNTNQRWKAVPIGDGNYRFEPQNAPGKRLDIENVNGVPRALSRTLDNGNSQRWKLIQVSGESGQRAGLTETKVLLSEDNILASYPNPFSTQTTLVFPASAAKHQSATIQIRSLSGQLLRTIDVTGNQAGRIQLDRKELSAGMYLYSLIVEGNSLATNRLMIE